MANYHIIYVQGNGNHWSEMTVQAENERDAREKACSLWSIPYKDRQNARITVTLIEK